MLFFLLRLLKNLEIIENANEEFFHYLEALKLKKTYNSKKHQSQVIECEDNKEQKIFISLPDAVLKPRIKSTILEIILEKIESKENSIFLQEINENIKIKNLIKVEPKAEDFLMGCLEEIINQGLLKKNEDFASENYQIEEKIFQLFFDFITKKMKGWKCIYYYQLFDFF